MQGDSQLVSMRCLAQGHLDTQLGGAGARTSNLPVTTHQVDTLESHIYLHSAVFLKKVF